MFKHSFWRVALSPGEFLFWGSVGLSAAAVKDWWKTGTVDPTAMGIGAGVTVAGAAVAYAIRVARRRRADV